jgi:hypothetical protein
MAHESFITSVGCAYLAAGTFTRFSPRGAIILTAQFRSPSGKLALTLDQSSIPPNFPVQLNTTYWQFFLPNLYATTTYSLAVRTTSNGVPIVKQHHLNTGTSSSGMPG